MSNGPKMSFTLVSKQGVFVCLNSPTYKDILIDTIPMLMPNINLPIIKI